MPFLCACIGFELESFSFFIICLGAALIVFAIFACDSHFKQFAIEARRRALLVMVDFETVACGLFIEHPYGMHEPN